MRRGSALRAALFVLIPTLSWSGGKGTSVAGFLKAGAGARAAGMAEAYSALPGEASAVYWNPAALTTLERRSALLMHAVSVESTAYSYGAYGQRVGDKWGFGLAAQHQTVGSLEGRDVGGSSMSGFTPTDTAFSLGVARKLGAVSVGVATKFVQSKIIDSANTATGDVGILWPGLGGGKFSIGFTATNLGGSIKYENVREDLPSAYRMGLGFRPSQHWTFGLDMVSPNDNDAYGALGVERSLVQNDRFFLDARAGYNTRSSDEAGNLSGAALGLGFGFNGLGVDYAFLTMGDLGQAHRMSLSFSF